jgi:hypothetical protein
MAGDWIKMTHALPEKPEVLAIAGKTGLSRYEVVGRLFLLWRWFDVNTTDGNAPGVTSVTLNECLFGYSANGGFVSAVLAVRWLEEDESGIRVVKFDEHTSESAKKRAQTAKRVAKSKAKAKGNSEGNAECVTSSVTSSVTKSVPREEKRRKEERDKAPPLRGAPKAARKCPDDFSVTGEMREWSEREVPGLDIDRETSKFRDHTFKASRNDWPATWRNWMRQAFEKLPRSRGPSISQEPDWVREKRERMQQLAPGVAASKPAEVFDVTARLVG